MVDLKAFAQKLGLDWDVSLAEDRKPTLSSDDDEQLSCSYSSVELAVGDHGSSAGTGTVFVTTRFVPRCWPLRSSVITFAISSDICTQHAVIM